MNFHTAIRLLKLAPILPEFDYWLAAWVSFGQIPESPFLKACLQLDDERAMNDRTYSARNYQDIKQWLMTHAPLESFGAGCLKFYPIKKQNEAMQNLTMFAEAQHSS